MRALITGGTGFIGSRLARMCTARGDSVTVLGQANNETEAQNVAALEEEGIQVVLGSIVEDLRDRVDFDEFDTVFHLAAAQHEMNIADETFWDVNVKGTERLLDACAEAQVGRFIHGSTIGVYGDPKSVLNEASPCNPDNIYGQTKLEGEKVAKSYRERLPVVIVRIPEVYGPGDRRLLKLFRLVDKGSFPVLGSGRNLHHLIYVDDLNLGLLLAAEHSQAPGDLFLLAGDRPISTDEMVGSVTSALGKEKPPRHLPLFPFMMLGTSMELLLRPLGIQPPLHRRRLDFFRKSFELSWEHARETLGFDPRVTFDQGARKTAEHYKACGLI